MKKFLSIVALALAAVLCVALVACETKPQDYDMSGVTFADKTVVYNGQAQTLAVSGKLPDGVTVAYEYFSGETKLEGAPVNAGTYKVVAKFTGDEKHNPIEDKSATLTITKAKLEVVLGATQWIDPQSNEPAKLEEPIEFKKNEDGSFTHGYDGKQYVIDVVSSNVDLEDLSIKVYTQLNEDGSVVEESRTNGRLSSEMDTTVYVLVTLDEENANFENTSVLASLTVTKRIIEIATAEDLQILYTDAYESNLPVDVKLNTVYRLVADIDLDGAVWKTIGTELEIETKEGAVTLLGEFDGQGHKISNFVINEKSIQQKYAGSASGLSIGFFGTYTDAYVHDVVFDDFTVDVDVRKVEGYTPDYRESDKNLLNPVYFGMVSGRPEPKKNGVGTSAENITVSNATITIYTYKGYIGIFYGLDHAGGANGEDVYRKNLVARNVTLTAIEISENNQNSNNKIDVGGLVGDATSYHNPSLGPDPAKLHYVDCSLTNVTLINGDKDEAEFTYKGNVGGLVADSTNVGNTFENCELKNVRIENWARGSVKQGILYAGNGGSATFNGCTVTNDNETDFGVFVAGDLVENWKDQIPQA